MLDNSHNSTQVIDSIYRIGQTITTGSMLTTYTAYNRNTNDVVGLSVIELPPTAQLNIVQQCLQPAEKRRTLQSSHIIRIYNWGIDGSRIYIATDPPRGVTLQYVLDNENISMQRAIIMTRQLAVGLKTLHEAGITGLDLRPQLITVDTVGIIDRVQIDDIGLRSLLQALGYISTQSKSDIGYLDPRYAAPEYLHGGPISAWSDIYQLGLLLFTLITGRLPFVGSTPDETAVLQSNSPLPPMQQFKHDVPAVLQQVVTQALAKDPSKRYTNAGTFIAALDALHTPPNPLATELIRAPAQEKSSSVGLTAEMTRDDLALHTTVIKDKFLPQDKPAPDTPATTQVYAYLCYKKNGVEVQRFPITQKSTIIGRLDPKRGLTPDIDLSKIDPTMTVSRQHARIHFEETFFSIEDLKSRNKTRLKEAVLTPLKTELLQHGDAIFFGSVRVQFEIPNAAKVPK